MARLIVQEIRRHIIGYVTTGWWATMLWLRLADGSTSASWALTLSLLVAFFTRLSVMDHPRELLVLPVSRRQIAHMRWMFGTVIPAAVVLTGKAAAMLMAPWLLDASDLHLSTLALSTVCDLAYLGVAYGVFLVPRIAAGGNAPFDGTMDLLFIVPFLGSMIWGLLLRPYIPTQWADLAGLRGVVVACGLGLVAWAYFYAEATQVRMFTVARAASRPTPPTPPPADRSWLPTSVTGSILRVVLPHCAVTSLMIGAMLLVLGDPFARFGKEVFTAGWIVIALVMPWFVWSGRLRQLRTLPMATWHINAVLLGTTVALWLSVWATVTVLHLGFPARIADAFRPELIAGLIGVSALSDAAWLQSRWIKILLALLAILLIYATLHDVVGAPPGLAWLASAAFGAIAFAAAAWLNHRALTRSDSVYRRERSTLSFAA